MALGPRPPGLSPQSPAAPGSGGRGRRPSSALAGRGPAHLVRRLPGAKSPRAALTGALIPPPAPRPSSRQGRLPAYLEAPQVAGGGPAACGGGPHRAEEGPSHPGRVVTAAARRPAAERRLGFATCSPRCTQRSVYRATGPRRAVSSPPCYGAGTAARGAGGLVNRSQAPRTPHLPPHPPQVQGSREKSPRGPGREAGGAGGGAGPRGRGRHRQWPRLLAGPGDISLTDWVSSVTVPVAQATRAGLPPG